MSAKNISYQDIADLPEDDRITQIGTKVMSERLIVGFFTDDEPGKPERYIAKLQSRFPGIRVVWFGKGQVAGTVFVKMGPPLV